MIAANALHSPFLSAPSGAVDVGADKQVDGESQICCKCIERRTISMDGSAANYVYVVNV